MIRLLLLAVLAVASLGACDKPTPESCRKALLNMQHPLGTEGGNDASEIEGEVRRCRGASSKEAVDCASKATTLDDLKACKFMKVPAKAPATGSGSAK